ncbi:membrane protein insertase YidC [Amylibacter marinus]|uniref:Membrane protein insertase YidC n=1 Tax=Amylibacter marinus TaxID=1475483 RepID=A0ABQ5VUL2_9RHOB|nr:membrane protein insertase YidC [Amylibacter marinus]GLQ35019.1 membrane protein insertase YidC [Amylibacter marinus]
MQDDSNKNMILATVLSMLVLLVWFIIFPPEQPQPVQQTQVVNADGSVQPPQNSTGSLAPSITTTATQTRDGALASSARLPIKTDRLEGSLSLTGARIDDLRLIDYNRKQNDDSEKVTLLSPAGGPAAYYILHGFIPAGSLTYDDVPGASTPWAIEAGNTLTQNTPVTLKWENASGLIFRRTLSIDDNYMFNVQQTVENTGPGDVILQPYGMIVQRGPIARAAYGRKESSTGGVYILHEGIILNDGEAREEIDYKDMPDEDYSDRERANLRIIPADQNGWIGFTGKYWMTTLIPDAVNGFDAVSKYTEGADRYQAEARQKPITVAAGSSTTVTSRLFAGAKEYQTIKDYGNEAGIADFIDSIDWGWFFFLTKPMFAVLHWLNGIIGNMGWAIIALTVLIKAILFPLAYKSFVSMARMKELQPEMEKLKEKHGDDRAAMQQEVMKLYRTKKVNPAAGCLPILLQIPIFFSLYKVIFVTLELRHAPFIGWLTDLSVPDPTSILNLFGLLPWGVPGPENFFAIFSIGVWPIIMGITMWLQQKLNPAPTDKTQAQIFAWMPFIFMFMLGGFASGLVIYWVANNTLTFIQQYTIMRSQGVKPDILGNIFKRLKKEEAK